MFGLIARTCLYTLLCFVFGSLSFVSLMAKDARAETFNAAKAFCDRQTFILESLDEVTPWLKYFSGLRNGASPAPATGCPSGTIRAIINISQSSDIATAEALRIGFLRFYVARAMEPELGARQNDMDGSFRYRNDLVLAGFIWFLCPGHGDKRVSCVKDIIEEFPSQFIQSSPVFCDFAKYDESEIEWPPHREILPLVCASGGKVSSADVNAWWQQAPISLGD